MRKSLPLLLILLVVLGSPAAVFAAGPGKAFPDAPAARFLGDRNGNRLADDLDLRLEGVAPGEKVPVIVVVKEAPTDKLLSGLKAEAGPFDVTAQWDLAINGFAAELTAGQIARLARNPFVERIDFDREVIACLGTATQWTGVRQARTDFGVTGDRDGNPTSYSKTDVVICVLDTGIYTGHVDLDGGKVIGWKDYINGRTTPYDDNGHGTHCASIAAGTGEGNSTYTGVAPGAALVGVKVLNSLGSGTTTGIINGINWMISNKSTYGIRIGSMSLGSSGSSDGTDSLSQAVNNAVSNGIIMVVAAGNSGPAKYTIGSPAAATNAVTVGALYDPGEKGWALCQFSSRGPTADGRTKPDISTPGYNITAARSGTTSSYTAKSGTSMATPFMAGTIALMLDANYSLTDTGVKNIIYAGGNVKDFGPAGKDIDFGYGIALCYNDVKQAGGFSGSWSDGLTFRHDTGSLSGTGDSDNFYISVTDASKPLAITFVIPDWTTSRDFDIYLYDPSGTLVASSTGTKRQEQILYLPTVTGTYRIRVYSYSGSGDYWLTSSWR